VKLPAHMAGHLWQSQAELRRSHPASSCGLRRGRLSPLLPVLPHGASWRRRVNQDRSSFTRWWTLPWCRLLSVQGPNMEENPQSPGRGVNRVQLLIGTAGLLVGLLVYLVDRPPDRTYFVRAYTHYMSLYDTLPNLFGPIGSSLPAFVHVFSFILITAGLLSCRKRGCLVVCLGWFFVDTVFELGQKFKIWSSSMVPDWFEGIPFLESCKNYFLLGTFDFFDLAAIGFGTVMAYWVLLTTMERS
jgi:hypothetical protein